MWCCRASSAAAVENHAAPLSAEALWEEFGGREVEDVLRSGAVALVDAQYLVDLAKNGGVLTPRQHLEMTAPGAFLTLEELKAATNDEARFLRIVCVSHCWLQPDHPDPRSHNLHALARALRLLIEDEGTHERIAYGGKWGVFLDFCSLHQRCRGPDGQPLDRTHTEDYGRDETETTLFRAGLAHLSLLYSHPKIPVLMLSALPPGYPEGYTVPEGANVHAYAGRGWCFCEFSWAMLVKPTAITWDLGASGGGETDFGALQHACAPGRKPPLLPDAFAAQLEAKAFTNGKEDRPLVVSLYREGFEHRLYSAVRLYWRQVGWGRAEAQVAADVLAAGHAPHLAELYLDGNRLDDAAICALAEALCRGTPKLRVLTLDGSAIGDAGGAALAASLAQLPRIALLRCSLHMLSSSAAEALCEAAERNPALQVRDEWPGRNAIDHEVDASHQPRRLTRRG